MANRKIPQDAFFFYVGLGPGRSYQQVADHYGVTKRAVVNLAVKERWQDSSCYDCRRSVSQRFILSLPAFTFVLTFRPLASLAIVSQRL